jgi:hypothetical protein
VAPSRLGQALKMPPTPFQRQRLPEEVLQAHLLTAAAKSCGSLIGLWWGLKPQVEQVNASVSVLAIVPSACDDCQGMQKGLSDTHEGLDLHTTGTSQGGKRWGPRCLSTGT